MKIYDENELLRGKLDILNKTNMVDYAIDIRKSLYPDQEIPEVRTILFSYIILLPKIILL